MTSRAIGLVAGGLAAAVFGAATPAMAVNGGSPPLFGPEIFLIIGMVAIFYFLILRPQQKRAKAEQEMLSGLRKGDVVTTKSGLIGKVVRLGEVEMTVELAEGVRVKMLRAAVMEVGDKTEPAPANDTDDADDTDDDPAGDAQPSGDASKES